MPVAARFPCPCCGYRVFLRQPGSSEKCPICLWEGDLAQLCFPATAPCVALGRRSRRGSTFSIHGVVPSYIPVGRRALPGSANHVSLEDAQINFAEFGSAEHRHRGQGRCPFTDQTREQGWRALDPTCDNIEEPQRGIDYGDSYPLTDTTVLYYWRETYWRRLAS